MRENLEVATLTLTLLLGAGSAVSLYLAVASFVRSRMYVSPTWRSTYVDEAVETLLVSVVLALAAGVCWFVGGRLS